VVAVVRETLSLDPGRGRARTPGMLACPCRHWGDEQELSLGCLWYPVCHLRLKCPGLALIPAGPDRRPQAGMRRGETTPFLHGCGLPGV